MTSVPNPMTLRECLRYWWRCRKIRAATDFQGQLFLPPNAEQVATFERKDCVVHFIGVRWVVRPHKEDICG